MPRLSAPLTVPGQSPDHLQTASAMGGLQTVSDQSRDGLRMACGWPAEGLWTACGRSQRDLRT
eukprot:4639291-Alexandrium_andersonii.AAC.1